MSGGVIFSFNGFLPLGDAVWALVKCSCPQTSILPFSKLLVNSQKDKNIYISLITSEFLLLAKSKCPFYSSCVTLWQNE